MNRRISLTLSIVALMAIGTSMARAHNVNLDLEYNDSSEVWELYALIDANGTGDSNFGLAAVRALIDNVDFGTFGVGTTGSTVAGGIGAINPVSTDSGDTDPVLLTGDGTIDGIYGQDLSTPGSVVGGVGASRTLIFSGTFTAGVAPAFGDDDNGLTSDATFLDIAAPGPFGNVVDADAVVLSVIDVTPGSPIPGDANNDGQVDFFDLGSVQSNFGNTAPPTPLPGDANSDGQVDFFDLGSVQSNFGNVAPGAGVASIPEPGTMALLISGMALMFFRRS